MRLYVRIVTVSTLRKVCPPAVLFLTRMNIGCLFSEGTYASQYYHNRLSQFSTGNQITVPLLQSLQ